MASRRLDISSLLCNDDQAPPEPVILAPHLRQPSQSSLPRHVPSPTTSPTFQPPSHMHNTHRPSSSRHRMSPPSSSYPLPSPPSGPPNQFPSPTMPSKLQSFGLEALVQAATEERRRLSSSSSAEPDAQRRPSPTPEQLQLHPPQHFSHQYRQHKLNDDHAHSPVLSPVHIANSPAQSIRSPAQLVRSPVQLVRSPVQLVRSPVYPPTAQHFQSRHRPPDRHRDEQQARLGTVEDPLYRSPQSAYFSPPMQPQPPRQQMALDHRTLQQHELERQRLHHEQLLLQEQQQQQQRYSRDRQAPYTERHVLPQPSHSSRGPSMPLHIEPPSHHMTQPQPHTPHQYIPRPPLIPQSLPAGRKSDPGQHRQLLHHELVTPPLSAPPLPQTMPIGETTSHPNKKRRYSDSPSHMLPRDEKGRIHPEPEKLVHGDVGYERPDPVAQTGHRQAVPGFGQGRKHLGLVELMTPNPDVPHVQPVTGGVSVDGSRHGSLPTAIVVENGTCERAPREVRLRHDSLRVGDAHEGPVREGHRSDGFHNEAPSESGPRDRSRLPAVHRRRSPPGSQSGRAIAAKKTEEVEQSLHNLISQTAVPTRLMEKESKSSIREKEDTAASHENKAKSLEKRKVGSAEKESRLVLPDEEAKVTLYEKETRKRPPSRTTTDQNPATEPTPPKKQRTAHVPAAPSPKPAEEDAHQWLLEHYDDDNGPAQADSPHDLTSPLHPSPPLARQSKAHTSTSASTPDAADELEQELEELLANVPPASQTEPDTEMDVDLVTELVAETLNDVKAEDVGMEDVEDELLSLLDDRPTTRRPPAKSATPSHSNSKSPPPIASTSVRHVSPPVVPVVPAPPAAIFPPSSRPSSTNPTSERGSMPPPTLVASGRGKDKDEKPTVSATVTKKKDALSKSGKNKATAAVSAGTVSAKSRAKHVPKPKTKPSDASLSTSAKAKSGTHPKKPAASRSRSTSVMPSGSVGPEGSETKAEKQEEEESGGEDDKLYCVCKTAYDEDRFMIACDRCDEWYHTQCVNMPDLEVDLVDQFICPPCIEKHPHLNLKTTYKTRCLFGLRHPDPSSPKACHRPARGVFSKYCSDACGLKFMQSRAEVWIKKGGQKDKLWETVKDAEKREGVVVCAGEPTAVDKDEKDLGLKLKKGKVDVERLNGLLDSIVRLREDIKKEMESVTWREKLLELATVRAEQLGECGWDQRLCFGDDEYANLGAGALASYNTNVDGENGTPSGSWWCSGKKACDRHAGWQAVRVKDVCKEKEKKNDALLNLTTREREIRKRIEDIMDSHGHNCNDGSGKSPLKASNPKLLNGHTKGRMNGATTTKGKKRKAPS